MNGSVVEIKGGAKLLAQKLRGVFGLSASGLVRHAKACAAMKTAYVWGGMGQIISENLLEKKREMYPEHYGEETWNYLVSCCGGDVRGFDCCGLIKSYLMGGVKDFRYEPKLDMNAKMLLDAAAVKGEMPALPDVAGLCLYMEGHVGIYVGEGRVIEATSNPRFGNGVVYSAVEERRWLAWFACPGLRYGKIL